MTAVHDDAIAGLGDTHGDAVPSVVDDAEHITRALDAVRENVLLQMGATTLDFLDGKVGRFWTYVRVG